MGTIEHNGFAIVDGVLQLDDLAVKGRIDLDGCTELTALPKGLIVSGSLDLDGCSAITALPDSLSVGGWLDLTGCTELTELPDSLSVGGSLNLAGCTALTALPDGLSVGGGLYLEGCTALTELPDGLSVGRGIFLDKLCLSKDQAVLFDTPIAHSIRTAAIGRRLGDLVDHWALSWNDMRDKVIESIEENKVGHLVFTLAPHAATAMSAHEIDSVIAGADHGDQTAHSYL